MNAEYTVGLAGADRDVRFLAGLCAGQGDIQVVRHSKEGLMLRAPTILTVEGPLEAARIGGLLLSSLNGIARIQDPDFRPLTKDGLYRVEQDGLTLTTIPQITMFDVRPPELTPRSYPDLVVVVKAALYDAKISRVLKLMAASEGRWFAWYWIYELALEELGDTRTERERKAVALGWGSQDRLRAFRATANWHETERGRHAIPQQPNQEPPPDLMHELEAQHLIGHLVLCWLRHRRSNDK